MPYTLILAAFLLIAPSAQAVTTPDPAEAAIRAEIAELQATLKDSRAATKRAKLVARRDALAAKVASQAAPAPAGKPTH